MAIVVAIVVAIVTTAAVVCCGPQTSTKGVPHQFLVAAREGVDAEDNPNITVRGAAGWGDLAFEIKPNEEEFARRVQQVEQKKKEIPADCTCPVCAKLMVRAVMTSCCQNSACDSCLQKEILSKGACPLCKTADVTPDNLLPNKNLRARIEVRQAVPFWT